MAVVVESSRAGFDFKPAVLLFESTYVRGGQPPSYDVPPDGRFVMIRSANASSASSPMTIVLNWAERLPVRANR